MIELREESDDEDGSGSLRLPELTTRRLILRMPETGDAESFAEVANSMAIASQMNRLPHPYTMRNAEGWIASANANSDPQRASFLVVLRETGAVAGAAGLLPVSAEEVELNYFLAEGLWGQGLATEAAQAVIDHAFEALARTDFVIGRCRASNRASRRVLEKCGFQHTGSGMCGCEALSSSFASEEFVLERSVWRSLKDWGRI